MSTTAIFAEILIIGLQATVWIALLVLSFLPKGSINPGALDGWEALTTVFVLAAAYTLGIVVDRIADSAYGRLRKIWDKEEKGKGKRKKNLPDVSIMRLRVMEKEDGKARFIDYQRSRLRVARATVLNVALVFLTGVYYLGRADMSKPAIATFSVALLIVLAGSLFAAERIHRAYMNRLVEAYEMWKADAGKPAGP